MVDGQILRDLHITTLGIVSFSCTQGRESPLHRGNKVDKQPPVLPCASMHLAYVVFTLLCSAIYCSFQRNSTGGIPLYAKPMLASTTHTRTVHYCVPKNLIESCAANSKFNQMETSEARGPVAESRQSTR